MELTPFYSGRAYYKLTADDGQTYVYTPQEFVNKGFVQNNTQFFDNDLLKGGKGLFDKAFSVTLPSTVSVNDTAKSLYQNPNQGYAWKESDFTQFNPDDFSFQTYNIEPGRFNQITGLGQKDGGFVYATSPASDWAQTYITGLTGQGTPNFRSERTEMKGGLFGGGFLGDIAGGISSVLSDLGPIAPLALNLIAPGAGTGLAIGSALGSGNIEGAIQSLALNQIGGAAGGEISQGLLNSGFDPLTAQALSNAAVTAGGGLLTGATPEQALQGAVLAGVGTGIAGAINQGNASYQSPNIPTGNDYTAGADYSFPSGGGLGIQAQQGEGLNLFNTNTNDGLGLVVPSFPNLSDMEGGLGLTSSIPSNYDPLGLTNTFTGQPLGQELTNLDTGGDALGNVTSSSSSNVSPSTVTTVLNSLVGTGTGTGTGTNMATDTSNTDLGSLLGGLLGTAGGLYQNQVSNEARKALADQIMSATKTAQAGSQFRPVGTTTTFGTSQFQIDPTTGQLTSAGYTLSPQAQAIQDAIMGSTRSSLTDLQNMQALGRNYLATSPEQAASDWMQKQQAVLQPGRDVALSNIRNKLFQTGRGGLSVAQGGNLGAANPEMQAYYNALAQQDAQLAAQAQEQGRAATQFGAGLLSGAYKPTIAGLGAASALENLGQEPLTLASQLANMASQGGARSGALGVSGAKAAGDVMFPANSYNPLATLMQGAGTSQPVQNVLGGLFGATALGGSISNWLKNLNASDWFSGAPSGLSLGDISLNDIANVYAGGNPFANILNPNETWAGE